VRLFHATHFDVRQKEPQEEYLVPISPSHAKESDKKRFFDLAQISKVSAGVDRAECLALLLASSSNLGLWALSSQTRDQS
jgi:hypothetical protein